MGEKRCLTYLFAPESRPRTREAQRTTSRAPATMAWPKLMPPSLVGTREWRRTRKPACCNPVTTRSVNSTFWKTPPDKATVATLEAKLRVSLQAATMVAATALWKRAAMTGGDMPATMSSATYRTSSVPTISTGPCLRPAPGKRTSPPGRPSVRAPSRPAPRNLCCPGRRQ